VLASSASTSALSARSASSSEHKLASSSLARVTSSNCS
jgi:hypothetical protein